MGLIGVTMLAVEQTALGGPDVLRLSRLRVPQPSASEVLIRVALAGVNFGDLAGLETGDNHMVSARPPFVPGSEVIGYRVDTNERVLALCATGGYAEYVVAEHDRVFSVPDGVDDATALALFVAGVTAWNLVHTCARIGAGDSVAVPAAAGGVGSLVVQLAKLADARVVGAASTERKRAMVSALGAYAVVDSDSQWCASGLLSANEGRGFDVVFETRGAMMAESLEALAPFGRLVLFATSGDAPAPVYPARLIPGSRSISGFWLMDCLNREDLVTSALTDLFGHVLEGRLRTQVSEPFPIADVRAALRAMRDRDHVGKLVLTP